MLSADFGFGVCAGSTHSLCLYEEIFIVLFHRIAEQSPIVGQDFERINV